MESNIIKEYETDTRWMFPYVDYDLRNYYNFSQLCNEERTFSIKPSKSYK